MSLARLNLSAEVRTILSTLGVAADRYAGGTLAVRSPVTGEEIGRLSEDSPEAAKAAIDAAHTAFRQRPRSAVWCRSKSVRSSPRASAKCRK
jgi:aldehyde dehydrogenase (NAD+)